MVSYTCPLAQSVLLGRRMTWSSVQQDVPSVRIKGFTTGGGQRVMVRKVSAVVWPCLCSGLHIHMHCFSCKLSIQTQKLQ